MQSSRFQIAALSLCAAAALTGCQPVVGNSQYAQVRFVEISPDAPPVDLYQNSSAVLFNVGPGTATSYIPVAPGAYTWSVNTSGSHQQLAAASGPVAAGGQYTVLVGDITASLQMTLLRDQAKPAPAGQAALRFIHQATRTGPVDLYLVAPGSKPGASSPIATDIVFGSPPVYVHTPSGTYSLVAVPSGAPVTSSSVPLYTGSQSVHKSGSAQTVILYDQPSGEGLQVLTANDVDPA